MTAPPSLRESFEAWLAAHLGIAMRLRSLDGAMIEGVWRYTGIATQHDWNIWQASAASMAERAAKVAEESPTTKIRVYSRGPNSPPGNQLAPFTRADIAQAIRSLIA